MSRPKVTIIGAGQVGATTALFVLEKSIADVTLIDVVEGLAEGKALDMMHARSIERFGPVVTGTTDYADTAGSDVVVVTAGLPRAPGMTRDDLSAANAAVIRSTVPHAIAASPGAVLIIVTNPLDVMTELAWRVSGLPAPRVLGMGGVLDSARFAHAIARKTGQSVERIEAVVIGVHGEGMLPLPRLSMVDGVPVTELLSAEDVAAVVEETVGAGAEVVGLLKSGSAFYAPAAAISVMVEAIVGDRKTVHSSCVRLEGHYGLSGVHLSVPAVLGAGGVHRVIEIELTEEETTLLRASASSVAEVTAALVSGGS